MSLRDQLEKAAPLVALSFSDDVSDEEIARAKRDGADVAELRIDRFSSFRISHVLDQVRRFATLPTIATIRIESEGGRWHDPEAERRKLYEAVVPNVDGVDVELAARALLADVVSAAHAENAVAIVSHHDFDGTPPTIELEQMTRAAKDAGADYFKVACRARSEADLRSLARFTLENADAGLIVVAMGEYGPASRVLLPLLGSRLTYAALEGQEAVSGQLPLTETVELLRRLHPAFADRTT